MAFESDRERRKERHSPLNRHQRGNNPPLNIAQKGPIKRWIPLKFQLKFLYKLRDVRGVLGWGTVFVALTAFSPAVRRWYRGTEEDEPDSVLQYLVSKYWYGQNTVRQDLAAHRLEELMDMDLSETGDAYKNAHEQLFKQATNL